MMASTFNPSPHACHRKWVGHSVMRLVAMYSMWWLVRAPPHTSLPLLSSIIIHLRVSASGLGALLCVLSWWTLCLGGRRRMTHYSGSKYTLQTFPAASCIPRAFIGKVGMLRQNLQGKPSRFALSQSTFTFNSSGSWLNLPINVCHQSSCRSPLPCVTMCHNTTRSQRGGSGRAKRWRSCICACHTSLCDPPVVES
jgi:hypothetical protein